MQANVDKELCVGCGACTGCAPEVFTMDDDGLAKGGAFTAAQKDAVEDAVSTCPVGAISTTD